MHWLGAADNSVKLDLDSADADENQWLLITVFERDPKGVRLSYSGGAHISGDHWRGVELLSPVWDRLELTR